MSLRSTYYTALVGSCISAIALTGVIIARNLESNNPRVLTMVIVGDWGLLVIVMAVWKLYSILNREREEITRINSPQEIRTDTEPLEEGGSTMRTSDRSIREEKARDLEVVPAGDAFLVKSSTRKGGYMVTPEDDGKFHCACMDYATHRSDREWKCKHIIAVETYLEARPRNGTSRYDVIDIR